MGQKVEGEKTMIKVELIGRAVIQIPAGDLVSSAHNKTKGVVEIVLEGTQYPNWRVGSEPMIIIGATQLLDSDFVEELAKHD